MSPPVAEKAESVLSSTNSVSGSLKSNKKPRSSGSSKPTNNVLEYTPVSEIPTAVKRLTDAFHNSQKTHSIQYRLNQLRNIYFTIKDNIDSVSEALEKDFNRSASETKNLEIAPGVSELLHLMASLHKWVKPEKVTDLSLTQSANPVYTQRIPLGVVLIISPFNYPFLLSISGIAGAIAAGNAVVWKPSEATPHFSQLLTKLLTQALDDDLFFVVNGGIPETTAVLDQKFDKIMYTGNNTVGTIVAKKAAETLTPTLLELGGKSPAILLDDITDKNLPSVARRLVWGRFTNGGQTCVAVDYVLVPESLKPKLLELIRTIIKEDFYPHLTKEDPTYTHVIHDRAFANLSKVIDSTKGDVIIGGERDEKTRYIAPTVIDNVDWDDSTMQQELFGPVLPIITYTDLSSAVTEIVRRHDTPLAQYIFTSGSTSPRKNKQVDAILKRLRSGAVVVNDVILHVGLTNAPFGGVGQSGQGGGYHGWYSFQQFTHQRTVMEQNLNMDFAMKVRYPPYSDLKDQAVQAAQVPYNDKVWFGRKGDVRLNGPNYAWSVYNGVAGVASLIYSFVSSS